MTNERRTLSKLVLVLAFVTPLTQACGPGAQNPGAHATLSEPVGDLPEPHGPMKFEPVTDGGVIPDVTPTAPANQTPVEQTPVEPIQMAEVPRAPLCKNAHDPNKQPEPGLVCPTCRKGQFTQPNPKRKKLDILFVADSSPSLETERGAIAAGIRQFVEALPRETDYRIAVMAAHSDVSYDPKNKPSSGLAGQLLTVAGEPAVLKGSDYRDWSSLTQALSRKLLKIRSDAATDGGEVGLYSLDKGISEPLLSVNRRLGFFRDDAALAVIFISDENDICSYGVNYPEGVTPHVNVNKYLSSGLTVEEKANQIYCRDKDGNPTVTSRSVFVKLRELKKVPGAPTEEAMPLLISGILYTSTETVPKTPRPNEKFIEYFYEKEVGYGYLDIIRDNQGVAVDISKENFREGLRQIGQAAASKLEVKSEFQLKDGKEIDESTLCVLVDGQEAQQVRDFDSRVEGMSFLFRPELREVHLRGIGARNGEGGNSKVEVFYCEPLSLLKITPELHYPSDLPTRGEHYRSLPVPAACKTLRARIQSGAFDQ
jgi:hypothetical protein